MNIFAFIIAFILFVGGLFCFGYAFDAAGYEAIVFIAGILAVVISLAIPFHLLKRTDR